jgi:hypothetical protein
VAVEVAVLVDVGVFVLVEVFVAVGVLVDVDVCVGVLDTLEVLVGVAVRTGVVVVCGVGDLLGAEVGVGVLVAVGFSVALGVKKTSWVELGTGEADPVAVDVVLSVWVAVLSPVEMTVPVLVGAGRVSVGVGSTTDVAGILFMPPEVGTGSERMAMMLSILVLISSPGWLSSRRISSIMLNRTGGIENVLTWKL